MGPLKRVTNYYSTRASTYSDGTILSEDIINGPPVPPPGYDRERPMAELPELKSAIGTTQLTVPAYRWVFGCSAVAGAMIASYYDRSGFPNIYTGPTNGGLMPLKEDPSWGRWTDSSLSTYPNNPLIASHSGLDGRVIRGAVDDYWVSYLNEYTDPYIARGWIQHAWGDAIGDFMKTSQSVYGNTDGATIFNTSFSSGSPLTCDDMVSFGLHGNDGTYGRKLFYESRGYTVTDCYNQITDNVIGGGFSFAQYKAEIDAGHPVLLNLAGHSVVGTGYNESSRTLSIHDVWDNDEHSMAWGGSYAGMSLVSVSIVNLQKPVPERPAIHVYPGSNNFGNVRISQTATHIFTISSVGTGHLAIGTIALGGVQASQFNLNEDNCSGQILAPSSTCAIGASFNPSVPGNHSVLLEIFSDDPVSPVIQIDVSGTGVFEVTPSVLEGTLGTEITFIGAQPGFGDTRGRVLVGGLGQKIHRWTDASVVAIMKKTLPPRVVPYDVTIMWGGRGSITLPNAFSVKLPEPVTVPGVNDHGRAQEPITINGSFFGTRKGKVYLEYLGAKKNCKVTSWNMGSITFLVPARLAPGRYPLKISNTIGTVTAGDFTIDPPLSR
jgi:hypothetical protein